MICPHCGHPSSTLEIEALPGQFDPQEIFHHILQFLVDRRGTSTSTGDIAAVVFNGFESTETDVVALVREAIKRNRDKLLPYGWRIERTTSRAGFWLRPVAVSPVISDADRIKLAAYLLMDPKVDAG